MSRPVDNGRLDDVVAAEARGDASNLKGSDYHLLYVIWLLVMGLAEAVHFFKGNDLLAQPIPPPIPDDDDEGTVSVSAVGTSPGNEDIWIQLKCTATPWTCSQLLTGNLIENFVYDSFLSESKKRVWRVQLVTTAEIRRPEIERFVVDPARSPRLNTKLKKSAERVAKSLSETGAAVTRDEAKTRALAVLAILAKSEPVSRQVLYAEIISELAFRIVDRRLTHEVQERLIGALLQDAAQGPDMARVYHRGWLDALAGPDLWGNLPLDESADSACAAQVRARLPDDFSTDQCVPRHVVGRLIEEFLASSSPIFVLSGRSGTGKSWVLAHWAHVTAAGRARLLIPGRSLTEHSSLVQLVADELRPLTSRMHEAPCIFHRLLRPSLVEGFGPLVVAIDDVSPFYGRPAEFARNLASIVDEAGKFRVKLLFACQADVLRNLQPFSDVRPADIFRPDPRTVSPAAEWSEATASCILDDFSDGELEEAVNRRVASEEAERVFLRLRDPAFAPLRNPYAFSAFFSHTGGNMPEPPAIPSLHDLASLIDNRIETLIGKTSLISRVDAADSRRILMCIAATLWRHVDVGISHGELCKELEAQSGSVGREVLEALRATGILTFSPNAGFSDSKIRARLFAKHLCAEFSDYHNLRAQLRVKRDHDVAVQMCTLTADPVELATESVDADPRWIAPFCEGLACCSPCDQKISAALVAFAHRETSGHSAADALGRFALGSRSTWKDVIRRFLGTDNKDRSIMERALWHVATFAPELVVKAIRLRFRLRGVAPDNREDRVEWRRGHAKALRALAQIDSEYAARHVIRLLGSVEPVATQPLQRRTLESPLETILRDPLLEAYDQLRALAAAYADEGAFNRFCSDLSAHHEATRARALSALGLIVRVLPERVRKETIDVIRSEQDARLLGRVIWDSCRLAKRNPTAVMDALEENASTCWKSYESSAAALALLELLARSLPKRVLALLETHNEHPDEEPRLLLRELDLVCRFRCKQELQDSRLVTDADVTMDETITEVQRSNALYALRAQIVHNLLAIGERIGATISPAIWRMELRQHGPDFFKVNMSRWLKGNENALSSHPCCQRIVAQIVAAARAAHDNQPSVLEKWRRNIQYWLVVDCLDVLTALLAPRADPEMVVRELPHDWETLYVCHRLLEAGNTNGALIDFAIEECEAHRTSATAQASHERVECLIAIQRVVPDRVPQVHEERHGLTWFLSGGRSTGSRLIAHIDEKPSEAIEVLESTIASPADAIMLESWSHTATTWSTMLMSQAYSRMFRLRRIVPADACDLCNKMLLALQSAPSSTAVKEHRALYEAIMQRFKGGAIKPLAIRDASVPLVQSHKLAAEILSLPGSRVTENDIRHLFFDRRGWWEDHNYRWDEDGTIGHGAGVDFHLVVFFPAVRLALCAVGQGCKWCDPGYDWTCDRNRATLLAQKIGFDVQYPSIDRKRLRQQLETALKEFPDQERLQAVHGHLLLTMGELEQAQAALERALASPLCEGADKGGVLYNLGCVMARRGDEENCRLQLVHSAEYKGLNADWMGKDPDLESVRHSVWFQNLLKPEPRSK